MDERMVFLNEVLAEMQPRLSSEDLDLLRITLLKRLEHCKMVTNTQLMTINPGMNINERYFKLFVASKRLEGASERTIEHYLYETKKLLQRLDKNIPDITSIDVQFYLSEYERRYGVCRRSLDNMRLAINGVFIWLVENSYISQNPMKSIKPIAYEKKDIEILTDDEIYDIREASRDNLRTRAIVELLLATGVRVSELCAINIEDINFDRGEILIHCAKKRRKQNRTLYLTIEASKCLKQYLLYRNTLSSPDGSALFISNRNHGRRCTSRLINETLGKIRERIGLDKHLTVHTFRRTLASILYKRGMQPLDIAHILGHVDSRMSETYYIGIQSEEIKKNYYKYR